MTTITATSILASEHRWGFNSYDPPLRVDTLLLRYPRCIHAEFMTHRVMAKNSASSRAIPVRKMIRDVLADPFVPVYWGRNQKGMQGGEELQGWRRAAGRLTWLAGMYVAVALAYVLIWLGAHKQIANRILEPWAHITVVVTSVLWSNFFALRDHKDAEPHIRLLAQAIRKARDSAYVQTLGANDWHLPFTNLVDEQGEPAKSTGGTALTNAIKLSVARCASTSFKTVDGFDMTVPVAIVLHDKLVAQVPLHASPCEHQCKPDYLWAFTHTKPRWSNPEQHGCLTGFIQYRKTLPGECR